MNKKLPLLAAGASVGLFSLISSLGAADAAAPAASGSASMAAPAMKPAAASASTSASAKPAAASGSAAVGTAANPDLSKLPAPSTRKDITFDKDIAPMLKASCANCHGGATPRSKFDVTTVEALLKGGSNGKDKDVVAGHSDQSLVVLYAGDAITKTPMPPLRNRNATPPIPALTKDQLAVLRAWIDQGAKDPVAAAPATK